MFSTASLAQIIRFYGHAMQGMMGSYLEQNLQTFTDVQARLAEVERLYLDRLMTTRDANEGLDAFLAKRQPAWEHR